MAKEHVAWIDDKLREVQLSRALCGDSKEPNDMEWELIEAIPKMALLPSETRVLKRNGRETRFKIDGKPCTLEDFRAYAKRKGIDTAKLEKRIAQSAGEREQITTRSEVLAE